MAAFPSPHAIIALTVCNKLADVAVVTGEYSSDDFSLLLRWLEVELADGTVSKLPMPEEWSDIWDLYNYAQAALSEDRR